MASFDKVTTNSTPTLAPKPIATAAPPPPPFTRERLFSDGDDDEEDGGLNEESEGEEEDEEIVNGEHGGDSIDLEKIRGENWSSRDTYASSSGYENALVIAGSEPCYAQTFNRVAGSSPSSGQNDPFRVENNGCGFSGQEEGSYWDVLRSHLSDPVTGALMDDAMILTCGHSYGRGGMQQVYLMKSCCKCSQPISEDLVRPNFALRSAVQAFRREEEMHIWKVSKRRRDQLEQEKCGYDDHLTNDLLRNRASLFPLAISDRVIIKGNKRTPPHFVGRVAVVTAQCLNGWYVVKTLDNGESVKLQFGSLAKVSADQPTSAFPTRATYPNWL
ncbi:U-box domain-containing protein 62-like protein [Carex littledalei]|uniref:U-box domain-containing protein 62-like protein n=1 Tax=Carex littledalei TaxID=544730 RepID=A0A833R7W2_9POAL|nr:U-box domain-containing protein 62-like protein [Carex littledalei]